MPGVSTRNILPLLYAPKQSLGRVKAGRPTTDASAGQATSEWAAGAPTQDMDAGEAKSRWGAGKPTSTSFTPTE